MKLLLTPIDETPFDVTGKKTSKLYCYAVKWKNHLYANIQRGFQNKHAMKVYILNEVMCDDCA